MTPRRLTGIAAIVATSAWLASLTPTGLVLGPSAALAFPPCMTPQGYLIFCCPKPCRVIDPAKLPNEVAKLQQEAQKLMSMAQQLQQWQSMLKSIGSNPAALLKMLAGGSDITALKNFASFKPPASLSGADFSTIASSKGPIAQMFYSSATNNADRIAVATDAKVNAVATGLHARTAFETQTDEVNKIVADAKKATTTRDELAIANRIRLAMLQMLRNKNVITGSMLEMFGSSSALSLGPEENSASGAPGGSAYSPYTNPNKPPPTDKAATLLGAANSAMTKAVDIHNAAAAANEMALAGIDATRIENEQKATAASAADARNTLVAMLSAIYADGTAAANALMTQAMKGVTADWPSTEMRTAQENAAAMATTQTITSNPAAYGTPTCQTQGCMPEPELLRDKIYAALDTAQQAAWYAALTADTPNLKEILASELDALSKAAGVNLNDAGAVDAAINAAVSDARLLITAFGAEISTDDQKSKAQAITATLDLLAQDPQKTHFIAYDPDLAPAPAPTAFKSAN